MEKLVATIRPQWYGHVLYKSYKSSECFRTEDAAQMTYYSKTKDLYFNYTLTPQRVAKLIHHLQLA